MLLPLRSLIETLLFEQFGEVINVQAVAEARAVDAADWREPRLSWRSLADGCVGRLVLGRGLGAAVLGGYYLAHTR